MGRRLVLLMVSCGLAVLARPLPAAGGAAPAVVDGDWRVRGALAALATGEDGMVAPALRVLASQRATVAFDAIVAAAEPRLADAHVRGALAAALGALQLSAERSVELLVRLYELDGFRADSEACLALERWRASSDPELSRLAARLRPPAKALADDWYACVGLWNQAAVDDVLARYAAPRARTASLLHTVIAAERAATATKVLGLLADPAMPTDVRLDLIAGLRNLGHSSREVLVALDRAADQRPLQTAAVAAIARLLPAAPPGVIAEARVLRWSRAQLLDDDGLAALGTANATVRDELTARLVRELRACRAANLPAFDGAVPAPIIDALLAGLGAADAGTRACAATAAFALVAREPRLVVREPRLVEPLVRAMREPPDGQEHDRRLALLIEAGATAEVVDELAAYYHELAWHASDAISSALAEHPPDAATAARLQPILLKHFTAPAYARTMARGGPALRALGRVPATEALAWIERTYDGHNLSASDVVELRFWAITLSGGAPSAIVAARWLAASSSPIDPADAAPSVVEAALQIVTAPPGRDVFLRARGLLRTVLDDTPWQRGDVPLLRSVLAALPATDPTLAELRAATSRRLAALAPPPSRWWSVGRWTVGLLGWHFLIWLALLLTVYPRSRLVQSVMLFNPVARNLTGLWYTQLLFLVSPRLRRRLFRPLVEGNDLDGAAFDATSFFDQVRLAPIRPSVNPQAAPEQAPPVAWTALAQLPGLVVIEGASGLGKTHVQRALLARARDAGRTCLFLRASECEIGVVKLLEQRLALSSGGGLVSALIYRGAIDLFLDGLNEAQPNAIAEIAQFCARAPHARIVLSTQPMRWACPARARRFALLPLEPEEFERFLRAQWPAVRDPELPAAAAGTASAWPAPHGPREPRDPAEAAYLERVRSFLAARTSPRDRAVMQNRIDLAFVAHLLARAQVPNIHSLRRQVVEAAARAYEASSPGGLFPMAALAAAAIRVLESGHPVIVADGLDRSVLDHLAERKLLLHRGVADWLFRHDTITCYFAAEGYFAPLINEDRVDPRAVSRAHLDSKRFVGVYLQLAESLPLPAAERLAERLRQHGRETADRGLEIEVQDVLDRRNGA